MLRPDLSKAFLNKLFHTSGTSGTPPTEEMQGLIALGIAKIGTGEYASEYGVKPELYCMVYQTNLGEMTGDLYNKYEEWRRAVNASQHWEACSYSKTLPYEYTKNDKKYEGERSFTGWYIKQKPQMPYYPTNAYLALFTKMPDEYGQGYVEPVVGEDGTPTTYIRVNLHEAIISGKVCITEAAPSPEGGSTIENKEIFVYPEVFGTTWGTVTGFGIMEKEEVGTGDKPVHWARLIAPLTTRTEKLTMFRMGCFKSLLR